MMSLPSGKCMMVSGMSFCPVSSCVMGFPVSSRMRYCSSNSLPSVNPMFSRSVFRRISPKFPCALFSFVRAFASLSALAFTLSACCRVVRMVLSRVAIFSICSVRAFSTCSRMFLRLSFRGLRMFSSSLRLWLNCSLLSCFSCSLRCSKTRCVAASISLFSISICSR